MQSLYNLIYDRPGKQPATKPAKHADEQPIKNDQILRTKLKQASAKVPKYLFRTWDAQSGGNSKLNSTSVITPHAFTSSQSHKSVYDMTRSELVKMISCHLAGSHNIQTEFSSWSHSPYFAFYYAHQRRQSANVHVAIIDAEELAKTNPGFHVPALGKILGEGYHYEEEYLVHGLIEGQFYKAVAFRELCDLGLLKQLPGLNRSGIDPFYTKNIRALPGDEVNYTTEELQQLRKIALTYGDYFSLPMAIVLFCCKKRPGYWSKLSATDLETIIKVLGGWNEIPQDWCSSRSLFSKSIYPADWDANQQVQNLMHALYTHCYGKGARGNEARYAAKNKAGDADLAEAMASMNFGRDSTVKEDKNMPRKSLQKRA
ncbi:hypothetical protein E4T44_02342 [Aureobasidium sp. EXF-8845]|nr:hypothetical protein E4T44_02342 [Aureobasidium sp. EXF-8845]KAI4851427.1 hypothetical protein E4T45_05089 [Aureobasidium sp. EXF-8846]